MIEKIIEINDIELLELYGVNNIKLDLIRSLFPKIKIVARGNILKILGEPDQIDLFEEKIESCIEHYRNFGKLTLDIITHIVEGSNENLPLPNSEGVILYGRNGKPITALTKNQRQIVAKIEQNDLLFAVGPAGSGKTYTAIAMAVRALKNKEVQRIILSRPAVEAGENLGFLPGDLKEKIDPYLQPLYDALNDMLTAKKLESYISEGVVQIAPLAFMRGRTLDNAFVILDEAQNSTVSQLKMFLTRMGEHSKFIITGDVTQIDLPGKMKSGLSHAINILKDIKGISTVYLNESDIVRHKLVKEIVLAYQNSNNN